VIKQAIIPSRPLGVICVHVPPVELIVELLELKQILICRVERTHPIVLADVTEKHHSGPFVACSDSCPPICYASKFAEPSVCWIAGRRHACLGGSIQSHKNKDSLYGKKSLESGRIGQMVYKYRASPTVRSIDFIIPMHHSKDPFLKLTTRHRSTKPDQLVVLNTRI
jgi:hypothetical protein